MTRILAALFLGLGVAGATWLAARGLFASPIFARRNVRGVEVPVGAGILAVLTVVAVQACFGVADVARDVVGDDSRGRILAVATGLGFGLVGIVDDLVGDHGDKGFGGHLRALGSGRLTTGGLKLLGGGLMSLGVGAYVADDVGELLVAASVIALGANTANLFDRAPGRVTKVALVAFAVLVVVTPGAERFGLVGVAALVGAVAGLFVFDLSEQLMLGDAGANPLGAVLGLGVVLTTGTVTQLVVLGVLVAVNVAGDRVSFSALIDRTGPLRTLDQLGRRPL
ncbi:MAG: hypothetical protein H0U29_02365 [Acidimicrobiia bacterium]|nr:hypothetical protein [Acidimicrobiia bacterium]